MKQNNTKQNKTKENKTKQNKTKQNKTKQNRTEQNRTEQIRTEQHCWRESCSQILNSSQISNDNIKDCDLLVFLISSSSYVVSLLAFIPTVVPHSSGLFAQ